jgi:polyferredoxin
MWLLFLIVIGGIFFPLLGYLVVAMMAVFLPLSYFKQRYWCWNLCPRGAFLDIVLSKMSFNKPVPRVFTRGWLRWSLFFVFVGFLLFRLMHAGTNLIAVGAIFVSICIITTLVAIALGVVTKHRGWCVICPMGTLQGAIGNMANKHKDKSIKQQGEG